MAHDRWRPIGPLSIPPGNEPTHISIWPDRGYGKFIFPLLDVAGEAGVRHCGNGVGVM
jgi:hypothetical protein